MEPGKAHRARALDAAGNTIAGSEIKYWPYGGTRAGGVAQTDKLYVVRCQVLGVRC